MDSSVCHQQRTVRHVSWSYELHTNGLKAMRHTPGGQGGRKERPGCRGRVGAGALPVLPEMCSRGLAAGKVPVSHLDLTLQLIC